MPTAPRTHRSRPPQPRQDRRAGSRQRGYSSRWSDYADSLCNERIFCELCKPLGRLTPICRGKGSISTGERRKLISVVDHIIPVEGEDDPLFWDGNDHWCLCVACDRWKTATFDGGYGHRAVIAGDRTAVGIERRKAEIIAAKRAREGRRTIQG